MPVLRHPAVAQTRIWTRRIGNRAWCEARATLARIRERRQFDPTLARVRPYSMLVEGRLLQLARNVTDVLDRGIPGAFVECGVWRGGASFLMADLVRRRGAGGRTVWMFDSFEGLPPTTELDGRAASEYQAAPDEPEYFDNCSASLEEVQAAARRLGLESHVEIVKGWFDQSLPAHRDRIGQIALLRIDGDWYESVKCCLEQLYDQVAPRGYIILDDYYDWQGCAIAVHEFLAERKLPHRIWTQYAGQHVVIRKE
jgi:O-methyltransferase